MAHCTRNAARRCLGPSHTLRTFIQHAKTSTLSSDALILTPFLLPSPLCGSTIIRQQIRTYNRRGDPSPYRRQHARHENEEPSEDITPEHMDERITAAVCNFIDQNGQFHPNVSVREILQQMDKRLYRLVHLNHRSENATATCKLHTHAQLEEARIQQEARAVKMAARAKQEAALAKTVKELQMSWGIAPNDLAHRTKKIKEFLDKGNRLEILIAKKKGMAPVEKERMEEVVSLLKQAIEEAGGIERKAMEGEIGRQVILRYRPKSGAGAALDPKDEEDEDKEGDTAEAQSLDANSLPITQQPQRPFTFSAQAAVPQNLPPSEPSRESGRDFHSPDLQQPAYARPEQSFIPQSTQHQPFARSEQAYTSPSSQTFARPEQGYAAQNPQTSNFARPGQGYASPTSQNSNFARPGQGYASPTSQPSNFARPGQGYAASSSQTSNFARPGQGYAAPNPQNTAYARPGQGYTTAQPSAFTRSDQSHTPQPYSGQPLSQGRQGYPPQNPLNAPYGRSEQAYPPQNTQTRSSGQPGQSTSQPRTGYPPPPPGRSRW